MQALGKSVGLTIAAIPVLLLLLGVPFFEPGTPVGRWRLDMPASEELVANILPRDTFKERFEVIRNRYPEGRTVQFSGLYSGRYTTTAGDRQEDVGHWEYSRRRHDIYCGMSRSYPDKKMGGTLMRFELHGKTLLLDYAEPGQAGGPMLVYHKIDN